MKFESSEAVILGHIDYGEADRIVTFLTPEGGRIKGFARGARRSRKRFGPALEPFSKVRLHWSPSRGGMVSLREAELLDLRVGLRGDLAAIALAAYGVELVSELFGEEQGSPELYSLLQAFLDHLAAEGASPEARLLFELRILTLAGYAPHLLHCSRCGGGLEDAGAFFDAGAGGSLCTCCRSPQSRPIALPTLGTLARILGGPADLFAGFRLSPRTLEEGGGALSAALRPHLRRPLKSLSFLEEVLGGRRGR